MKNLSFTPLPISCLYLRDRTYYRIVGDPDSQKMPLLLLHSSPGSTHNDFEVLDHLPEV